MHKLLFLLPAPLVFSDENPAEEKGSLAGSYFDIFRNLFLFFLSANEKWKKLIIFLYLLEKIYLTLYQFELLTP